MSCFTRVSRRLARRRLLGIVALGCFTLCAGRGWAENPVTAKQLILEPRVWELSDLEKAEREIERLAARQVERWNEWKTLFKGTDRFIEEIRQRLLEEHARQMAYDDVAQAAYPSLRLRDGWVRFPMWGAYDGTSNQDALAASIAADKRRNEEELATWAKGDVMLAFPFYPDFTANGVQVAVKDWDRRIADFEAMVRRGDMRIGGRPWFFGSATRNDLANIRRDSERVWREKEERLNALGGKISLREIGFATVADVDREIENSRRELKEVEERFARKEYPIDRLGFGGTRLETEKRIASWQQEINERRKAIGDGTFKASFPRVGWHSRKDFEQDNVDLRNKIEEVNTVVRHEGYKVDVVPYGLVDAGFIRGAMARSKDEGDIRNLQDGLRRIPVAATMHKRYFELMMLRNDQWAAAIPKLSPPAFVRNELEIQQANQFLEEYDREWALFKARSERKLEWLSRCRAALTGEKILAKDIFGGNLPEPNAVIAQAVAGAIDSGADVDAVIRILQEAIQKLEELKRRRSGLE